MKGTRREADHEYADGAVLPGPATETVAVIAHGIFPPDKMQPPRVRALLAEAALQRVDLCFVRSSECEPATGTITAWRWGAEGWWASREPMAPVAVIVSDPETNEEARLDEWLRSSTQVLGAAKRDKQGVASLLVGTVWERTIIPSEVLEPDRIESQLADWLSGGGIVVKPNDGMRGIGVQFLIPDGCGQWEMVREDRRQVVTADEAIASVRRAIAGRMAYRSYVVQRYIDTRDGSGRPGTVRSEVVRQPGGAWRVVRITGRISAPGKIVSTISRGASLMTAESYFLARGAVDLRERMQEVEAVSVDLAERLAASDTAHHYEWGFDFVLDPQGGLWFLEANSRPLNFGGELERATHVVAYLKSLLARLP